MRLRAFTAGDAADCYHVFYRAVHEGAARAYSAEERAAWASAAAMTPDWGARLAHHPTLVALRLGAVCGFLTLGRDGHIDLFYVLPEERGRGTADRLYEAAEAGARAQGLGWLTTEASLLARPFLERRGWICEARQSSIREGVALTSFRMAKCLALPVTPPGE